MRKPKNKGEWYYFVTKTNELYDSYFATFSDAIHYNSIIYLYVG